MLPQEAFIQAEKQGKRSVKIYELFDYELDALKSMSSDSPYLNFAISLLSIATSLLAALVLTDVQSTLTLAHRVFWDITVMSYISGAFLLYKWHKSRKSRISIIDGIKEDDVVD